MATVIKDENSSEDMIKHGHITFSNTTNINSTTRFTNTTNIHSIRINSNTTNINSTRMILVCHTSTRNINSTIRFTDTTNINSTTTFTNTTNIHSISINSNTININSTSNIRTCSYFVSPSERVHPQGPMDSVKRGFISSPFVLKVVAYKLQARGGNKS